LNSRAAVDDAMTEQEWLSCTEPTAMLAFLRAGGRVSGRKLRLFACACCRHVWNLLIDERSRVAVESAELLSDGLLADSEAQVIFSSTGKVSLAVRRPDSSPETILRLRRQHHRDKLWRAAFMAAFAVGKGVMDVQAHLRCAEANLVDGPTQSRILRDIFGALAFRTVRLDPPWLTPAVVNLALTIYNERTFDRLPFLADALEDAGCTNEEMLTHCRGPGPHVRGCWVVDLLLNKE
jgi:hypothetical protein